VIKKKLKDLIGLIIVSVILSSCLLTHQTISKPKEQRTFWGTKQEVIEFLNSPNAQSNRWLVEALGD